MIRWTNEHDGHCPVTLARRGLTDRIASLEHLLSSDRLKNRLREQYSQELTGLREALPWYDSGGERETELCHCKLLVQPTAEEPAMSGATDAVPPRPEPECIHGRALSQRCTPCEGIAVSRHWPAHYRIVNPEGKGQS